MPAVDAAPVEPQVPRTEGERLQMQCNEITDEVSKHE